MKHTRLTLITIFFVTILITGSVHAQDDGYTIGIIGYFDTTAVVSELSTLGYVEGENITYLFPFIEDWETMAPEDLMAEYQRQYEEVAKSADVDLFLTNTDTDAVLLLPQLANPQTPIVFARSDDPVATGAVEDLVSPGGNITGNITNRPHERRLQILTEIKPETDVIYYLYSVMTGEAEAVLQQVQIVAEELGVEVVPGPITDVPSALALLEDIPEGVDWLFLTPYVPFDFAFYGALDAAAIEHRAGITGVTSLPTQSYVMGYGPSIEASDRQAARTIDRILRGADPADLPIQIAENELMINLEAAQAIELEIPVGILRQADLIVRPGDFDEMGMYIGNN